MKIINFSEVEASIQNARVVMNAYLRCALKYSTDGVLNITLKKKPLFYFEAENGKQRVITHIQLNGNHGYTVTYNNNGEPVKLTDLSANELFMLCSIVESFVKDMNIKHEQNVIEVECEIVK